ncbi:MAG: bifunctional anthranilate synthase component I family protein/class IV aminotransferase [Burkholderiales bacterium]|nr:bifunctional anthranilate synthase component I family protein/class IV aminotransferase [Burkholderiales bacterium]
MDEHETDVRLELDFPQDDGGRLRLYARRAAQRWVAHGSSEVRGVIDAAHAAACAGRWVAGFVAYEAASAFDPALRTQPAPAGLPLAAFFAYEAADIAGAPATQSGDFACGPWRANDDARAVREMVGTTREGIAAGAFYQVNLSTRLRADFSGDGAALHRALVQSQPHGYCLRIATPEFEILSVSPELFFDWRDDTLVSQPMKGTAARAADPDRDAAAREALARSGKDRAENVMIVDLIRNDLSRIARIGSVRTRELFAVQALPSVWQMTSTVACRTRDGVSLAQVFGALFPCGSVTGAPKISAMEAIAELESSPRGIYCGALGVIRPGGHATFNVPIRTVALDRRAGRAECGIGSGITIHSTDEGEHAEWLAKRRFLLRASADFALLETMRLSEGEIPLWPEHRARLRAAAEHFGFALREPALSQVRAALREAHARGEWRVRLLCTRDGTLRTESFPLERMPEQVTVVLAKAPVRSDEEFLFWKTTARGVYAAHEPPPGVFDTLLWNERSELTEFTRGNLVLEIDGRRLTPPRASGLLPGVQRAALLRAGEIVECVVHVDDLARATRLWFINSVRGWLPARMVVR